MVGLKVQYLVKRFRTKAFLGLKGKITVICVAVAINLVYLGNWVKYLYFLEKQRKTTKNHIFVHKNKEIV